MQYENDIFPKCQKLGQNVKIEKNQSNDLKAHHFSFEAFVIDQRPLRQCWTSFHSTLLHWQLHPAYASFFLCSGAVKCPCLFLKYLLSLLVQHAFLYEHHKTEKRSAEIEA